MQSQALVTPSGLLKRITGSAIGGSLAYLVFSAEPSVRTYVECSKEALKKALENGEKTITGAIVTKENSPMPKYAVAGLTALGATVGYLIGRHMAAETRVSRAQHEVEKLHNDGLIDILKNSATTDIFFNGIDVLFGGHKYPRIAAYNLLTQRLQTLRYADDLLNAAQGNRSEKSELVQECVMTRAQILEQRALIQNGIAVLESDPDHYKHLSLDLADDIETHKCTSHTVVVTEKNSDNSMPVVWVD